MYGTQDLLRTDSLLVDRAVDRFCDFHQGVNELANGPTLLGLTAGLGADILSGLDHRGYRCYGRLSAVTIADE